MRDVADKIAAAFGDKPVYVLSPTKDGQHVASIERGVRRVVVHADHPTGRVILHGIDLVSRETEHWVFDDRAELASAVERGVEWLS